MSAQREPVPTVARWFDLHVEALHAYAARRVGADLARDVVSDTFRIALEAVPRRCSRKCSASRGLRWSHA